MVQAGERIHVIGIAGSGAAGVALLMHHAGAKVDGCDIDTPSPYTPPLTGAGVTSSSTAHGVRATKDVRRRRRMARPGPQPAPTTLTRG